LCHNCWTRITTEYFKLNNLYPESSDDEADRIIEEANLVEAKLKFGSRSHCEVREQL